MKKNNKFLFIIVSIFVLIASITTYVSFSSNINTQEVVVKSITPVYDENSTVVVDNNNVVFNDKNQVVEYKVVIENTQSYDVKINNITLSTPTEEFLTYEVDGIDKDEVLGANSTKEFTIYLETKGIKGWGRNFQDELIANISFDRVTKNEEVKPPVKLPEKDEEKEEVKPPKEEVKLPEKPAQTIQEVIKKTEKVEVTKITKNTIEFKEDVKVEEGQKIAVWIYSEPIFLGYFDVVEINGIKQIVGLEEALKEADIESGEHHIVLTTEESETIGYVEVYVDEKQEVSQDKPENDGKIENPYTSTGWLAICLTIAGIAIVGIVVLRNKKVNKYLILAVLLSSTLSFVEAEETIELSILLNVNFKSQNIMKPSGLAYDAYDTIFLDGLYGEDYWAYARQIKSFYIQNESVKVDEYAFEFDVTEEQNGRVKAYLIDRNDDSVCYNADWEEDICYDLYLQADGIIYPNEEASYYFAAMGYLDNIDNLAGIDTSEVTNMRGMFNGTGEFSESFTLDVSNFNTSNVTNMSSMFLYAGYINSEFTLNVSNFDTSKVIDMSGMFFETGYESETFILDVSNFNTSSVTDMSGMFYYTGYNNPNLTLDVSNFDTSHVTDMSYMFSGAGENNPTFTLDVSNFDTSNVTDMSSMFSGTGYNSETFTLDLSNFDTSTVTSMSSMFYNTGYNSRNLTLDVSNFNTSNVTNMSWMFASTGYNSETFTLDLSNFDTSKVTDMSGMFYYTGYNSRNLTLDVSNFDTSNVTDMSYMFSGAGFNSENFTLDVSSFDTSKATNMDGMFSGTGYNSTKLNTSITISNPNTTSYWEMFYNVATKEGSQIKVNYTKENENLVVAMVGTRSEGANVEIGNCIDCDDNYIPVGTEVNINGEKFNVISQTDDTITMLAQYNLDTNYKQSTTNNYVTFSDSNGWEYAPGPKEIDIQEWSTNPKIYVNAYVEYLKEELSDDSITGDLITLKEFEKLGCLIPTNYGWVSDVSKKSCNNSPFSSWIINGQLSWTSSTYSNAGGIFALTEQGVFYAYYNSSGFGIRPVITISKETLKKLNTLIRFKIDGKTYYAEEGMYWSEWVASKYNVDEYELFQDELNFHVEAKDDYRIVNDNCSEDTIIIENKNYEPYYVGWEA